jgi:hypothetical protein
MILPRCRRMFSRKIMKGYGFLSFSVWFVYCLSVSVAVAAIEQLFYTLTLLSCAYFKDQQEVGIDDPAEVQEEPRCKRMLSRKIIKRYGLFISVWCLCRTVDLYIYFVFRAVKDIEGLEVSILQLCCSFSLKSSILQLCFLCKYLH